MTAASPRVPKTRLSSEAWRSANQAYLAASLEYLRLLLKRRVQWLRRHWQQDPLEDYKSLVISEAQADWLLNNDGRQAEARFYREDVHAAQISGSLAELETDIARQGETMADVGSPPAIEVLARLLDLTPFEIHVLLLCLAPDLDPSFERLFAYVQDDVTRKYVTPHLALALFDDARPESSARDSFLPGAPLRRFQLVHTEPSPLPGASIGARPLRLDDRIADYLRGVNRCDERVAWLLRPIEPAPLAPDHRKIVAQLADACGPSIEQGRRPVLNLFGSRGAGKRSVARELSERFQLRLYRIDLEWLPAAGLERQEMLHLLERETILLRMALYLDLNELDPVDKSKGAVADDVIEHLAVFLIVGSREPWRCERKVLTVQVPKLTVGEQRALWHQALGPRGRSLADQIAAIVQQFDLGPHAIAQAVVTAEAQARLRGDKRFPDLASEELWQACRQQAGWNLDQLAKRLPPCFGWNDIVLPDDVFDQLKEISAQVAHRAKVYEDWGFGARLSRGRGISALFSGPSGTGKTMAAEILANHLKLDLYRIDLAGVVSKYIGETEKNLRRLFDAAEESGAILFFDEADALFGKRAEVKDSHDRYANIEIDYLLQRMEDYRGLAILATNRKSDLDRAFLRRLRFTVDFPFPDAESRRRIWQKVFPLEAELGDLDYDKLARLEIPGGNIRNIALNAAFRAADEGRPIGMAQLIRAAHREYAKMEKMMTEVDVKLIG